MPTLIGTVPVDQIQKRPRRIDRAYSWEVIDAPDPFWLGRSFRKIDIDITASCWEWPDGIVFQNVHTKRMLLYWQGNVQDITSLSYVPQGETR